MPTHLIWLRNDLRINDNKALYFACSNPNARVLAVFIATPKQWQQHGMAPRQANLIYSCLLTMQKSLAQKGISLYYHSVTNFSASIDWLVEYCLREKVDMLFYNRQYELNEWNRDAMLEKSLKNRVICHSFNDNVLLPPGTIKNNNGHMYKIYTPFRNAFIKSLVHSDITCLPAPKIRTKKILVNLNKIPNLLNYSSMDSSHQDYPPSETVALSRLRFFCLKQVKSYLKVRDFPAILGTSNISPYLAIGVLSPRQCFNYLFNEHPKVLHNTNSSAFGWLNELIWRDFYRHLMFSYPDLCRYHPFISWTDNIRWSNDTVKLKAWEQGKTGYPIIDAAMRQLNTTGWMHNRLRMISASFLVKHLLINWRDGERYFMSQLLDGDIASNNGGWQWVSSTGTDSVPYFRIFNPITQSKRFDLEGIFIRKWLPELATVPNKYIHYPHIWATKKLCTLNYPKPIVDHKQARLKTIEAFKAARFLNNKIEI